MVELRTRLRRLLRSPIYVLAVVLSLGLGTSVTLAALSVANVLVFKPLPGVSDRRNLIRARWATGGARLTSAEFEAMGARELHSFSSLAAQGESPVPVMLPAGPEALSVAFVSPQLFTALGTRPLVGRLLGPGDAAAGAAPVAVLSEPLWRRAFNSDPRVLNRALIVGERAFAIVGITPESFSGLRVMDVGERESDYPQMWLPLRDAKLWPATGRPNHPWLSLAGRLSPSSTLKSARAELDVAAGQIAAAPSRDVPDRRHAAFQSYRAGLDWRDEPGQSLLTMALFLFVPLSVLAIGCVNVINLQLARGMDEAGELSLRLALGASRARILRLLLLEVTALAAICAGLGCMGARILLTRAGAYMPVPPAIDGTVLAGTLVLVMGVVCVAGLLPAWQTSRDIVASGLREFQDQSRRRVRLRNVLIVVQVAASVTLLALGGLAIRSVISRTPATAADTRYILAADFDFTQVRPAAVRSGLFIDSILEDLGHAPSIRSAAFATFVTGGAPMRYWRASDQPQMERIAYGGFVTAGWFAATGVTFIGGSDPGHFAQGSAVVNRALAASLEAGGTGSVIGTRLRGSAGQYVDVAGVVSDSERGSDGTPLPMLFLPMPGAVPPAISLIVRANDVSVAKQSIQAAVTSADPSVPIVRVDTMEARLDERSRALRAFVSMAVIVGLLSIALAGVGLHSLLSYTVRRRKREIGIRMALGAGKNEIVWLVTAPALWLVSTGAAAGLAAAFPIAIVLRSVFFGASSIDVKALLPSIAILLGVAVAATLGPAYHAVRVDPARSLRED